MARAYSTGTNLTRDDFHDSRPGNQKVIVVTKANNGLIDKSFLQQAFLLTKIADAVVNISGNGILSVSWSNIISGLVAGGSGGTRYINLLRRENAGTINSQTSNRATRGVFPYPQNFTGRIGVEWMGYISLCINADNRQ